MMVELLLMLMHTMVNGHLKICQVIKEIVEIKDVWAITDFILLPKKATALECFFVCETVATQYCVHGGSKWRRQVNQWTSCDFVEECIHCNGCIPGPVNNWAICHWKVSKYFILEIQSKNLFMFLIFEQHSYRTAVLLRMKQHRATTAALLMDKNTAHTS